QWYSGGHTNQVVQFFFKSAGAADIKAQETKIDHVRGSYIDNTNVANLVKETWWNGTTNDDDNKEQDTHAGTKSSRNLYSSNRGLVSGLAGAGIVATIIGAIAALAQSLGVVSVHTAAIDRLIRQFM